MISYPFHVVISSQIKYPRLNYCYYVFDPNHYNFVLSSAGLSEKVP